MIRTRLVFLVATLALGLLSTTGIAAAQATHTTWQATLTGAQQVPPVDTSQHAVATIVGGDTFHYTLQLTTVTKSPITMAHIHMGAPGTNGPVVVDLCGSGNAPACGQSGTIADGVITRASLVGPLAGHTLDDLAALMKSGQAYVNLHTQQYPAGEIRGQIVVVSSAASESAVTNDQGTDQSRDVRSDEVRSDDVTTHAQEVRGTDTAPRTEEVRTSEDTDHQDVDTTDTAQTSDVNTESDGS